MKVKSGPSLFANRDMQDGRAFHVRPATELDQAPICRLLVAAYREYQWCMAPNTFMMYITELVDLEPRLRVGRVLVAERAGHLVGTVSCGREDLPDGSGMIWPPGFAVLHGFAVRRDARRLGVGAALIEQAVAGARSHGAGALGFHIAPFMTSALALAQRFGCLRAPAFDVDPAQAEDPLIGRRLPLAAYVLLLP